MNIVVDTEASGPCVGCGDLIEFAAVAENGAFFKSVKMPPLCDKYSQGAYDALRITRDEHSQYTGSLMVIAEDFHEWLQQFNKCVFWSDNPAFDWQWIN